MYNVGMADIHVNSIKRPLYYVLKLMQKEVIYTNCTFSHVRDYQLQTFGRQACCDINVS